MGGRGGVFYVLLAATVGVLLAPAPAAAFAPSDVGVGPPSSAAEAKPMRPPERFPLPAGSGHGRRVVYDERTMHVWVVNTHHRVVRDWKVSGRRDWPLAGTYQVFSKSEWSRSTVSDVGFRWMVRFAHGHTTNIGFHQIPYDSAGRPIQSTKQLGHPVTGGGCVRSGAKDAKWLYRWAGVGTTVVVLH